MLQDFFLLLETFFLRFQAVESYINFPPLKSTFISFRIILFMLHREPILISLHISKQFYLWPSKTSHTEKLRANIYSSTKGGRRERWERSATKNRLRKDVQLWKYFSRKYVSDGDWNLNTNWCYHIHFIAIQAIFCDGFVYASECFLFSL